MLDQFLLELKRLPRPQPILAGFVVAFLAALLFAYREVIEWYWLPRWGDPNGYYSYAYLVPPLAIVMIWMRREQLLKLRAQPSWWGVPVLLWGAGLHLLGTGDCPAGSPAWASRSFCLVAACCSSARKSRVCCSIRSFFSIS